METQKEFYKRRYNELIKDFERAKQKELYDSECKFQRLCIENELLKVELTMIEKGIEF
jgi:hypothetical protein